VETPVQEPDATRREALRRLLDDPSPAVRGALLKCFAGMGAAAGPFLREVASGSDRLLAGHATRFLEELKFTDPAEEFRTFIRSLNYELESGALLMARTVSPRLDVGWCCATLDSAAARCRELISEPSTRREKCRVINRVLFHELGFRGDLEHFTDPRNSLIDQVLARRKGIPVSLCTVYLLVAGRLGIDLEPVALPGYFMVGSWGQGPTFFIDPFESGLFRGKEEVLALLRARQAAPQAGDLVPSPVREVLCRSCRNLVSHFLEDGDGARAQLFAGFVEQFEAAYARNIP